MTRQVHSFKNQMNEEGYNKKQQTLTFIYAISCWLITGNDFQLFIPSIHVLLLTEAFTLLFFS